MIRWLLLLPFLLLLEKPSTRNEEEEEEKSEEEEEEEDKDPLLDDDGKPIRDPKAMIKSLKEANRRLAKKLEKKDQRIKKLEDQGSNGERPASLRSARLESAFMRAVFEYRDSIDLEAAWDLATLKGYLDGVKVAGDGTVVEEDMEAALEKLVDRYPYLIQDDNESVSHDNGDALPKTRQPRPSRQSKTAVDRAALERRYPALRRRRRGGV